ncbi:hypothetical protein TRVL_00266 [Trypanosoma vivax]|uniref:Trypanosoma vivax n=1 Tax=Trypanosoma vivax (strain Y486) TaxID=1055687 RepID=G0TVK1_TRYVY|nr:hypothetical protein TRVL_00266 [Trypanosoma vivax]CCC47967.1 hypothetical protein TVY486_0501770 [Trypanosoma vivax Y486]
MKAVAMFLSMLTPFVPIISLFPLTFVSCSCSAELDEYDEFKVTDSVLWKKRPRTRVVEDTMEEGVCRCKFQRHWRTSVWRGWYITDSLFSLRFMCTFYFPFYHVPSGMRFPLFSCVLLCILGQGGLGTLFPRQ